MKVVVVGAGYAGTLAANRLARKLPAAEVTVVNPRPDFVERSRLHQQLVGTGAAATPLASMLRDGVTARVGTVDKIGDGGLTLDDGDSVDFDHVVLAVGSSVQPLPGTVPVGTWEDAERARPALAALPANRTVTVVGGGPTGLETASEVAAARPDLRVRLVGSPVAVSFSGGAHRRIRTALLRLGVELVDDEVTGVHDGGVHLGSGTSFASDLTLWAVVSGVPDLAARSGLAVDGDGRVVVDGYLRSVTDERILAVGDCAAVPGSRFAMYTALPQGAYAATSLAARSAGRGPEPFRLLPYVGLGISLGRTDAVAQFTHRDDTLRRGYLAGRALAAVKELATRAGKLRARTGTV